MERSNFAEAGGRIVLLITISWPLTPLPYSLSLPSLSGRRVEPSREIPANNPREREYDRISARSVTSVAAAASAALRSGCRGQVGAELDLAGQNGIAPRRFITNRTKSVAWPPNWKPKLAPSRAIMEGALQGPLNSLPLRQVMTPRP